MGRSRMDKLEELRILGEMEDFPGRGSIQRKLTSSINRSFRAPVPKGKKKRKKARKGKKK